MTASGSTSDLPPDQELLAAYRAGGEQAATQLFERYYARLIEMIRREQGWRLRQAEGSADIAQSALRSFFTQLRENAAEVGQADNLWPLLVTITLNKMRNRGKFWQRQRRDLTRQTPLAPGEDPLEQGPSPADAVALKELIENLLTPFSDRRRKTVEMILEGHTNRAIAQAVGTTERTIYNTRQAAARILQALLDQQ